MIMVLSESSMPAGSAVIWLYDSDLPMSAIAAYEDDDLQHDHVPEGSKDGLGQI